ncbi:hypothetical protein FOCG_09639 [Fusarium oxysporum f. sp. radicis-lycopersici 26381]|uniref:Uncharacterized protein n=1 Tax=Fusarium oxysporum Fo47 TaxID=660027 RepID=W9LAL4_FUSOX|nr:hypothetical protein FOZG_00839 [Fusarium oxysporum Fo47]EXL49164.1 hypothetical protein FOCG_09639 [Fusarium oxysporum f. sp. radicis-lycopersici 26381]KAJ4158885.1 hypothetical protein NW765_012528 [Fusarium oxysporum]KAJ4278658.1 hypothetical protein NW764_007450 [Fusarium oxysporum]RKK36376.1 hypothetical protein BFJ66_g13525 [Fusarium oxysporum f. sp. cepae]
MPLTTASVFYEGLEKCRVSVHKDKAILAERKAANAQRPRWRSNIKPEVLALELFLDAAVCLRPIVLRGFPRAWYNGSRDQMIDTSRFNVEPNRTDDLASTRGIETSPIFSHRAERGER